MSLIKKLSTIAAATALSLGLATNVLAEPTKEEITKDAAKYKTLITIQNPENEEELGLRWNRKADGENNVKCFYEKTPTKDKEIFKLKLKKAYEDKNRDGNFSEDEIVTGEEYSQFKLIGIGENSAMLGRDEDKNGVAEKLYTYRGKGKSLTMHYFVLGEISIDRNNNSKFGEDEIIWQNWLDF